MSQMIRLSSRAMLGLGLSAVLAFAQGSIATADPAPAGARTDASAIASVQGAIAIDRPVLRGTARVGSALRAVVSSRGTAAPSLHYDWLRDGVRIGGAHASSYRLKAKDRKHRIAVRVTASAAGAASVTKTSERSSRVRPRSIDDPRTTQVVVNKQRRLKPKNFTPSDLVLPRGIANGNGQPVRRVVARAAERMHRAAAADGVELRMLSGYRSYALQVSLFNAYVARDGLRAAETYSARPGHSEHQTGLAIDFGGSQGCALDTCFASTSAGRWLKKHAPEYGFILRYPKGYTHITGYIWEPYHYRYVGTTTALAMKKKGIRTLEQYRHLPAAPDYR
ncbi:MAG: M15 family metallopeptidase [Actinobacteria bacterium]|nr:M15 family metallopeptidase [Actinomycetota bacterium]